LLTRGRLRSVGTIELTQLVSNLCSLHARELTIGYMAACCSDHRSFWEQSFRAMQVFESAIPVRPPCP
jgi:hypothetical protein